MSDQPSTSFSQPNKSDKYDPKLDIASELFDPLKYLQSNMKVPYPKAKVFDNLRMLDAKLKLLGSVEVDLSKMQVKRPESKKQQSLTSQTKDIEKLAASVRRFLPHQELVPKAKKKARNILTRLDDKESMTGPMQLLHTLMEAKTKVKIYIRKEHGVRGYITGFVEAFDHHFNIGLRDVYEVYKRRKYAFSENKVGHLGEAKDCSALLKRMGIDLPKVEKAQSLNRKYVEISRKCENMLIRGEQVVLVTIDQETKKS